MITNKYGSVFWKLATSALFLLLFGCAANVNNRFQGVEIFRPTPSQFTALSIIFVKPALDSQDIKLIEAYFLSGVLDRNVMRQANERVVSVLKFNNIEAEYVDTLGAPANIALAINTALNKSSHVLLFEPVSVTITSKGSIVSGSVPVGASTRYRVSLINKAKQRELQYYSDFEVRSRLADSQTSYAATLINTLGDYGVVKRASGEIRIPPR